MRKLLWSAALLGFATSAAFGAIIDFKNVADGVWNTGIVSNAALVGSGGVDSHYVLIPPVGCTGGDPTCQENATAGNIFGPSSYVVMGPNGTYPFNGSGWPYSQDTVAGANAHQWIGPRADQTNPQVGGTFPNINPYASNDSAQFYVYRTVFNLSVLGINPSSASITLKWISDNPDNTDDGPPPNGGAIQSFIRLCTGMTGTAADQTAACGGATTVASGNPGQTQTAAGFASQSAVTINTGFTGGYMAMDFVVFNSISAGLNPTGLRVLIVSAQGDSAIPEPATFGLLGAGLLGLVLYSRRKH